VLSLRLACGLVIEKLLLKGLENTTIDRCIFLRIMHYTYMINIPFMCQIYSVLKCWQISKIIFSLQTRFVFQYILLCLWLILCSLCFIQVIGNLPVCLLELCSVSLLICPTSLKVRISMTAGHQCMPEQELCLKIQERTKPSKDKWVRWNPERCTVQRFGLIWDSSRQ